jgi:molybdopterin-guanine dinucleotide biosynthesis protein
MSQPVVIGIGGYASEVGKTTLLCELLRAFPDAEAIKTTRGHYRSCGKDPHACCVSHLLGAEPLVRSGREATYERGKDTGRYWDAGAANVHWVIATDEQLGKGIQQALERVQSPMVFVEGNSFSEFVQTDCMLMVKGGVDQKLKKSAKKVIERATPVYVMNIYDELPEVISRVRNFFTGGTTETEDRHQMSAGLKGPSHCGPTISGRHEIAENGSGIDK